jgi:hypothetical protein
VEIQSWSGPAEYWVINTSDASQPGIIGVMQVDSAAP